ncbi:hypothetical protein CBR_g39207 [Chara braunii]|uniref:NADH-ubiquinone oxidoreductase B9 subunit n=1 Tax=Chara braunii TaxID=69332 RepID=A0A388LRK6_CHABU|nr:hypothetical protein CBR_g39207 [Chara braunii]|eukprot:GBG84832.1 hypothetical protein CBR_g39207 [Chara braunii]
MRSMGEMIRYAMIREPVVMWSCFIAGIGVALPIIVPPIKNAFPGSEPVRPLSSMEVVNALKKPRTNLSQISSNWTKLEAQSSKQ